MTAINQQTPGIVTIKTDSSDHFQYELVIKEHKVALGLVYAAGDENGESITDPSRDPWALSTARLLAAAYTAFDGAGRKLGVDAAEMAERLGAEGLAEVLSHLQETQNRLGALDGPNVYEVKEAHAFVTSAIKLITGK